MKERRKGSNLETLYTHNRRVVIEALRRHGELSIPEIARAVGLRIPSVGTMIRELLGLGLVEASGVGPSSGGRPPTLYQISPGKRIALAVDLIGTDLWIGAVNLRGEVTWKFCLALPPERDQVFPAIVAGLKKAFSRVNPADVAGIGIAVPGHVDRAAGTVPLSVPLRWVNFPLVQELAAHFDAPVVICKESEAAVLAEHLHHPPGEADNSIFLNIGTGVGIGIMVEGQVYRGEHGASGEWGHTIISPNGPRCWCGNRGCLEEMTSLWALVRYADPDSASAMCERGRPRDGMSLHELAVRAAWVLRGAATGDRRCVEAVDRVGSLLGMALFNLVQLFDPKLVVTDVAMAGGELVFESMKRHFARYRQVVPSSNLEISRSRLHGDARLVGAGIGAFDHVVEEMKSLV